MVELVAPESWDKVLHIFKNVSKKYDHECFKRRRIIDSLMLVTMILKMVNSKRGSGYGSIIGDFWLSAKQFIPILSVRKPISQSSFSKARDKLDPEIFREINLKIVGDGAISKKFKWHGLRVLCIDGSKINVPKELKSSGFSLSNPQSYFPQGLISCLYDLKAKVPVDFILDPGRDERKCAKQHLTHLSKGDLVVYDRGFQSFSLFYDHIKSGVEMVLRIDTETTFNAVKIFAASRSTDKLVEFVPAEGSKGKIRKNCPEVEFIKIKLRLVKYRIGEKTYILATTLLDRKKFPLEVFPDLYHSRWGVEEMYKTLKSHLGAIEFHGKTLKKVEQELFAGFLMITIARLFSNSVENYLNRDEAKVQTSKKKFKAS